MRTWVIKLSYLLLALFSAGVFAMSFFSEDKVIKSAEGYGFSIGMSKSEVFERARQQYTGKSIYMLDLVNESGKKDKRHVELRGADFNKMNDHVNNLANDPNRPEYSVTGGDTCYGFASGVAGAGS